MLEREVAKAKKAKEEHSGEKAGQKRWRVGFLPGVIGGEIDLRCTSWPGRGNAE
jgi:hypothetical protein